MILGEREARRATNRLNSETPSLPMLMPLEQLSADCYARIEQYLQLQVITKIPAEMVSRKELSRTLLANVVDIQQAALEEKPPSKVPELVQQASGFAIGGLLAFLSSHVLGLFDQKLFTVQEPRLLILPQNVDNVAKRLNVPVDRFLRWVVLHETMHAVQYATAPHLRMQLRTQVRRLFHVPRKQRAQHMKELVAMMSFVEGQAEHIMDAAATISTASQGMLLEHEEISQMRAAIDTARESQHWLIKLLNPTGGKMRQYQQGKQFCDQIVAEAGSAALALPLHDQVFIPSAEEIGDPQIWLRRARPVLGI